MPRRIRTAIAKRANKSNPRIDRRPPETDQRLKSPKRVVLLPKNLSQERYIDALVDDRKNIVLASGCAGTGKTYLATLYAIKGLQEGQYKKIIVTRPAVSVDESHGFLPGDLNAKLEPWAKPITDVLKEYFSVSALKQMIADEIIELAALAYMRGRNLKDSIVILDEAQNALPTQMKMVMTRLAEGSKLIITGDLAQHDRGFESNGFKDFISKLQRYSSDRIALCRFKDTDIERHPIIEDVLRIYGDEI